MYFHKHGLLYFLDKIKELYRPLTQLDPSNPKQDDINKINKFFNDIYPKFKRHLRDIEKHRNGDHVYKKVHDLLIEQVFMPERNDSSKTYNDQLHRQEEKIRDSLRSLAHYHGEMVEKVKVLDDFIEKNREWRNSKGSLGKVFDLLGEIGDGYLGNILKLSEDLARILKELLEKIEGDVELKKKLLNQEEGELNDYEANLKSWLDEAK